tara:strand:- start:48 stop:227 length:180 start_codon:yes stop_codon:yes gene_type:complete
MRQAGLKPKSHNSGVYWVRASANPGGAKAEPTPERDTHMLDKFIAYCIVLAILIWYFVS